jgi:hypothetical protein
MTHRIDVNQGDDANPGQHARLLDAASQPDERPTKNEPEPSPANQRQTYGHNECDEGQTHLESVVVHAPHHAQRRQWTAHRQPEGMIRIGSGVAR